MTEAIGGTAGIGEAIEGNAEAIGGRIGAEGTGGLATAAGAGNAEGIGEVLPAPVLDVLDDRPAGSLRAATGRMLRNRERRMRSEWNWPDALHTMFVFCGYCVM